MTFRRSVSVASRWSVTRMSNIERKTLSKSTQMTTSRSGRYPARSALLAVPTYSIIILIIRSIRSACCSIICLIIDDIMFDIAVIIMPVHCFVISATSTEPAVFLDSAVSTEIASVDRHLPTSRGYYEAERITGSNRYRHKGGCAQIHSCIPCHSFILTDKHPCSTRHHKRSVRMRKSHLLFRLRCGWKETWK